MDLIPLNDAEFGEQLARKASRYPPSVSTNPSDINLDPIPHPEDILTLRELPLWQSCTSDPVDDNAINTKLQECADLLQSLTQRSWALFVQTKTDVSHPMIATLASQPGRRVLPRRQALSSLRHPNRSDNSDLEQRQKSLSSIIKHLQIARAQLQDKATQATIEYYRQKEAHGAHVSA
jgi:hypothetical protein